MILFGMESLLTRYFLQAVQHVHPVELCVIPAFGQHESRLLPSVQRHMITPATLTETAAMYGVPVFALSAWRDIAPYLASQRRIVVCCFPRRIPAWIRQYPHCNIHPSLLPALRGPDPLFYTARGDAHAGVSVHRMDATYDTGDILMQTAVDVSQCEDETAFIRQHALIAAQLFGDDTLWHQHAIPQPLHGVSYAGHPVAADFVLEPHWTLARVRQFMRCTNARNHPYWVPQLKRWVTTFAEVEMLTWGQ